MGHATQRCPSPVAAMCARCAAANRETQTTKHFLATTSSTTTTVPHCAPCLSSAVVSPVCCASDHVVAGGPVHTHRDAAAARVQPILHMLRFRVPTTKHMTPKCHTPHTHTQTSKSVNWSKVRQRLHYYPPTHTPANVSPIVVVCGLLCARRCD